MHLFEPIKIPDQYQLRFASERTDENRRRSKLASFIFFVLGTGLMIQHQLIPGGGVERGSLVYEYYRDTYIIIFITSLLGTVIVQFLDYFSRRYQDWILGSLLILYVTLCLTLNLIDLMHSQELLAFTITIMFVDNMFRSTGKFTVFLHIYSYVYFSIGILCFSPQLDTFNHIFLLVILLVGLMIWWSHERVWKIGLMTRIKLEQEIRAKEITEQELKNAQYELIENAHKAGMAEIASDTLHNVGNILNSLKTSAQVIIESLDSVPLESYSKACKMIRDNNQDLEHFILHDEKGSKLLEYFLMLEEAFINSFEIIKAQGYRLDEKASNISEVILAQQSLVGTSSHTELLDVVTVIEDALLLVPELLNRKQVVIERNFQSVPQIKLSKTKLLHSFVNLFNNAAHAIFNSETIDKKLSISVTSDNKHLTVEVADNGYGISLENQKKIFTHGFTTKKDGNGFGLHSCAIYLQEMGAEISVKSDGIGKGAAFFLKFALDPNGHV